MQRLRSTPILPTLAMLAGTGQAHAQGNAPHLAVDAPPFVPVETLRSSGQVTVVLHESTSAGEAARRQPQQGIVTGRVVDATNQRPIAGVSVELVGTGPTGTGGRQLGTVTQGDGTFTIAGVRAGAQRFRARRIGYAAQELPVTVVAGQRATLNFQLTSQATQLSTVVAVGYTTTTARQLTSAVQQVQGEQLNDVVAPTVTAKLQGKAAGVFVTQSSGNPTASPEIRIRGTGSISASASPLTVVDGVIGGTADPNDVASVTVLKDAAATALYGSRAANGVIVITTKRGRDGATRVSANASYGTSRAATGNFRLMDAAQFYDLLQQMGVQNLGGQPVTPDLLQNNTDWQSLAFRPAPVRQLDLGVSGGDARTNLYAAGNYYGEQGTLVGTGLRRLGGRLNLEHHLNDRLTLTTRLNGRTTRGLNQIVSMEGVYASLPFDYPYNADGSVRTGQEADWRGRSRSNFLYPLQYNRNATDGSVLNADLRVQYDFAPWLSFATSNRYTTTANRTGSNADARTPGGSALGGTLYAAYDDIRELLTSNLLTANHTAGEHRVRAIGGVELQRNEYDGFNVTGAGIFPGLEVLDAAARANSAFGSKTESAFLSGLFQAEYDYGGTYLATFSFRRDGSSRFGANNRYGNFYSVSGGWLVSNLAALKSVPHLDQLKLRASYGTTGNAGIGDYAATSLYSFTSAYAGVPAALPSRVENPDLTWEVARTFNAGFDLGVFRRTTLAVDVYRRVNTNLLLNVTLPGTAGINSITRNIGAVANRGLELALTTGAGRGRFDWTTAFNVGWNRNRVVSLNAGQDIPNGNQRIMVGRDLYTWHMRKWAGVDPANGDPLWELVTYDSAGNLASRSTTNSYSRATLQPVGVASPDYTGGLQNTFRYGPVSLNATFNFVRGGLIYNGGRGIYDTDGGYIDFNYMQLAPGWSRWQKPGDQATHPKPVPGGNQNAHRTSSRYLESGSYVRMNDVTLAYDVPNAFMGRVGARSARVYVSGNNLWTSTRFSGTDPQVDVNGGIADFYKYPISRRVLTGVSFGF